MGYRFFDAGEFLEAADVQEFLMDQALMIFTGGTAARAAALGTAVKEGMVTYIGGGVFEYYDGTSWERWP
jgi:hypothetical protein